MIKVSVLYPTTTGGRFDLEYYQTRHMPMVADRCGDALKRGEVERGIASMVPGSAAPYCVTGNLFFESIDVMQAVFDRHLPEILADVPNYTDIQPTVQISEVLD